MDFCFLVASERSGSNLLTRLMDGHAEVCGPSPTHLLRILLENQASYGSLTDARSWLNLLTDAVALMETKLGSWTSSISMDELVENVEPGSLWALFRYIYEKEARSTGARLVFVKENHVYRYYPFIDRWCPNARFVHLVRDPRDMALSWKLAPELRGCVIRAAETWSADQRASLVLHHALTDTGRIVRLRYEDLVAHPDRSLRHVCALIGIRYDEGMKRLDERPSNRAQAYATSGWSNLCKPVMRDNVAKYRDRLSPEEIQFIEGACAVEMHALGYSPDFTERTPPTRLRAVLHALEADTKPQFDDLPDEIKRRHARRGEVIERIRARAVGAVTS